jgi:glycosyltransferase involved in cell wall biosynthesis
MRVYQVNTYGHFGGAAIAAKRLNCGLNQAGVESLMVCREEAGKERLAGSRAVVLGRSLKERAWLKWRHFQLNGLYGKHHPRPANFGHFGYDLSCYGMALLEACQGADLLNLHWVSDLLDYPYVLPRLSAEVPWVWTLHDLHAATGGCFYSMHCRAFEAVCGKCPALGSDRERDMSTELWERKARSMERLRAPLSLVTPSRWLAGEIKRSSLMGRYPVQCIPNAVDTDVFSPSDREECKQDLGLRPDAPVIIFAAAALDNPWKGLKYLIDALPMIQSKNPDAQFLAAGYMNGKIDWPVPVRVVGVPDERGMPRLYQSADLLVVPSVADNFPNVIIEAMACGVPSVGFKVGGIPEAIIEGETGAIAPEQNSAALANTIHGLLLDVMRNRSRWSEQCRARAVREYALNVQAGRYISLYRSMLEPKSSDARAAQMV